MISQSDGFELRMARDDADLHAAQRLRYRVFIEELGGSGALVDHAQRLEKDAFDAHCEHLILCDPARPTGDHVIGVYRLMTRDGAAAAGRFYCDEEYDLGPLERSGRRLLELGRSCLDPDHRGGSAMHLLWRALGAYVAEQEVDILFGVASFHGTDIDALAAPLSLLHHRHLAPEALRARSKVFQPMDLVAPDQIDRKAAMLAIPSLIKAYLRLGGTVGEGAFVDHDFNTTDVCLILDTARLNARAADRYRG